MASWNAAVVPLCLSLLLLLSNPLRVAHGQQLAAFDTLPFATLSHRQNFCDRSLAVIVSGGLLKNALNGVQLRPVIQYGEESFPYFNYHPDTGIHPDDPGLVARILDYIGHESRANFTWRNSFGVYTASDKPANKTWTELLQWTTATYDISIDKWAKNTDRLNRGIAFCEPWFDASMILVDKIEPPPNNDKNQVDYGNWLRPFENEVWFLTIGTIVVSCFVYQIIEFLGGGRDERSFRKWFMDNLYLSSINFTQNYVYEPTSLAAKVFGISFAFWTMLIGATYTANLASLLVDRPKSPPKIDNIEQAIAQDMSMCTFANANSDLYIQDRYQNAKRVAVPSPERQYQGLNEGTCDLLVGAKQEWLSFQYIQEYNPNCDLEWVGRTVATVNAAFATKVDPGLQCTSLVNEVFNFYLSEMVDNGFLDQQWAEFNEKLATPNHNCNANTNAQGSERRRRRMLTEDTSTLTMEHADRQRALKGSTGGSAGGAVVATLDDGEGSEEDSLTLNQMAGVFLLHAVGSAVAILVAMLSWYEKKANKQRHSIKGDKFDAADSTTQLEMLWASNKELAAQMEQMMILLKNVERRLPDFDEQSFHSAKTADEQPRNGLLSRVVGTNKS